VSEFAAELISGGLDEGWDLAIGRHAEYRRTDRYLDAEEAVSGFREAVRDRLRAAAGLIARQDSRRFG
jgi:hypothetical protein